MAQAARLSLRMQKELKLILSDPPPGASFPSLSLESDVVSLSTIDAQMEGPEGTVYAKGVFKIKIQIPDRYPFQPPAVTFATPIYHPNIDNGGRICLDILNLPPKGAWQPSLNISTVLTSIGLLLSEPNPDDGLMCEASKEYKYNRQVFDHKARSMTEKYAAKTIDVGNSSGTTPPTANKIDESNSSHKKSCDVSSELPFFGDQATETKKIEDEEMKGSLKECDLSHQKLHGTRRKLSLAFAGQAQKREADDHALDSMDFGVADQKSSTDQKPKKLCLVGKKLSLGLNALSQKHEHDSKKENMIQAEKLPQTDSTTSGISQKLSLGPLIELQRNHGDMKPITNQLQEEAKIEESIIVCDSEDSEEEVNVPVRSKLSLGRRRIMKQKAKG